MRELPLGTKVLSMPGNGKSLFFCLALFLVGAATLAMPSGYSLGFYLICFVSFGLWLKTPEPLVPHDARYLMLPLLIYAIGQSVLALHERWAAREFETYLPFVLVCFGFWGLRKYKPDAKWFWRGLAVGAILSAVISSYQSLHLGVRASGFGNHPIQFGNIALLLGVLCMVRALVTYRMSRETVFLWGGVIAGLAASVWSQSRGGWVAVILIFLWILANATKGWSPVRRGMAAFVLFGMLMVPLLLPNGIVEMRISNAMAEYNAFFEKGIQDTSIGARLAMWKLAAKEIGQAPWLGAGNMGWIELRDAAVADGRLHAFSSEFVHLHNEYLNVLFKRGVVGLALYLMLYLIPMLWFFKPYLMHVSMAVRSLAMAGMVVPMMYLDFGLSQTFLSHNSGRLVFCSLWMCVAALMLNAAEDNEKNDAA